MAAQKRVLLYKRTYFELLSNPENAWQSRDMWQSQVKSVDKLKEALLEIIKALEGRPEPRGRAG